MTLYWLLFAFAAAMALTFPVRPARERLGPAQGLAMVVFALAYIALAALRYKIGGDWDQYDDMYDTARGDTLREALGEGDPGFWLLLKLSAMAGLGIYPVNGICAALMVIGTIRLALTTREPWLGILAAVPYLLIVVGMGYVRQAAAIGLIMIAVAQLGHGGRLKPWIAALAATGLHLTAAVTFPLFGWATVNRSRTLALALLGLGSLLFVALLSTRLSLYEAGYLDQDYDSGGATVRLLMNLAPSLVLLLRWRHAPFAGRERAFWLGGAIANVVAMVALQLSPSSTAVDRMGLYLAPVQIVALGCLMDLVPLPRAGTYLLRILAIALLASVQAVWLILATHADLWVPYRSLFELG